MQSAIEIGKTRPAVFAEDQLTNEVYGDWQNQNAEQEQREKEPGFAKHCSLEIAGQIGHAAVSRDERRSILYHMLGQVKYWTVTWPMCVLRGLVDYLDLAA